MLKKILFLITTYLVIAFPKTVNAQWVPMGTDVNGNSYTVNNERWLYHHDSPRIILFYSWNSSMSDPRGMLTATNCDARTVTFMVYGNIPNAQVSTNAQDWIAVADGGPLDESIEFACAYD